eukprot:1177023-Prorocentrum_minimum.AAC.1
MAPTPKRAHVYRLRSRPQWRSPGQNLPSDGGGPSNLFCLVPPGVFFLGLLGPRRAVRPLLVIAKATGGDVVEHALQRRRGWRA